MSVTVNVYTIILQRESVDGIGFYYNVITKEWVDEFQLGCGCKTKQEAIDVLNALDIIGPIIIPGEVDMD